VTESWFLVFAVLVLNFASLSKLQSSNMDFKLIFLESCEEFKLQVRNKIREYNNFRVCSSLDIVKRV